jgi:uncharacterized protein (TIGR03086 family)
MTSPCPSVDQLARALEAVGQLIAGIRDDQWSVPTPCTEWNVRDLVGHLVGTNRVIAAVLTDQALPKRGTNPLGDDPVGAYRDSGRVLQAIVDRPGVLERTYQGPLGPAIGAVRLNWRIADLLVHGWDLAQATGQPVKLPDDLVAQALIFVRTELPTQSRAGRFDPAQPVDDDAPLLDQLVAFAGRAVKPGE